MDCNKFYKVIDPVAIMAKVLGLFQFAIGGICGLASGLHTFDYVTKEGGYEVDLLRGASAYVQEYDGETPKEPLEYVNNTFNVVRNNQAFKQPISELEIEVSKISEQIGDSTNPSVYKPVLNEVSSKISKVVNDKAGSRGDLPWALWFGTLALVNVRLGFTNYSGKND